VQKRHVRPEHLAAAMGISLGRLWAIANNFELGFKPRRDQHVGKKVRTIDEPKRETMMLVRRLHKWLQRQKWHHPIAHGAVCHRSCFTSANVHLGKQFIWCRDATDCYPSIHPAAFLSVLERLGFRHDTASLLTKLSTVRGQMPQGSPVSGDALNLFLWQFDQMIACQAGNHLCRTSRVADDFQLSSDDVGSGEKIVGIVEVELSKLGLKINERKKNESGFKNPSNDRTVHGISVVHVSGTSISREYGKTAIQLAESYLASCKSVTADSLEAAAKKRQKLVGFLSYCRQAHFSPAKHIRRLLSAGDRHIEKKLRELSITAHKNKWWTRSKQRDEAHRIASVWRNKR
jgi:hypothetical protein